MKNNISKVVLLVVLIAFTATLALMQKQHRESVASIEPVFAGSSRLSELLGDNAGTEFPVAVPGRDFSFPQDHGAHPEFRNEWWYITGNLDGSGGERFGFELTLFRFSLSAQDSAERRSGSAWQANQVYIGHFAVSDESARQFHVAQRFSRGAAGLAGAGGTPLRVWLDDWQISTERGEVWTLRAAENMIRLELELVSQKRPVLNGRNGYSQKSANKGNASYYYSLTRLESAGTLRIADATYDVNGLSWLDREWGSSALSREQVGWDWFALQFADGSEFMYYRLRRSDGSRDAHSAGTYVDASGVAHHLTSDAVLIEEVEYWHNERGDRYPVAWAIQLPEKNLQLEIVPLLKNQELNTAVRYWEGAVDVYDSADKGGVIGRGYVELTGYAR
jgi:predicted secreted hydrolase